MTKAGASLTIIPLSYRTFFAEMFKMDRREWLELFFLNAAGHMCSLLLHRHSVEQFAGLAASLFYEDVSPVQIELEDQAGRPQPPRARKVLRSGIQL